MAAAKLACVTLVATASASAAAGGSGAADGLGLGGCPELAATESGWVSIPSSGVDEPQLDVPKAWWWLWKPSADANGGAVGAAASPVDDGGPLLLWLIGGPGGSGARDAVYQGGACSLGKDGTLVPNPHSIAGGLAPGAAALSVLYLDEWEWAGYSGGGAPVSQTANATADRIYGALGAWLRGRGAAPQQPRDLYVMGYSAAGQYLPVVAAKVLQGALSEYVTLRGIALGNGLIDPLTQIPTWGPYLFENKLINSSALAAFDAEYKSACEPALLSQNWSAANACWDLSRYCPVPDNLNIRSKTAFVSNPPEFLTYFRTAAVKQALHAEDAPSNWTCFNSSVYTRFQLDLVRSYKWAMEAVLAHGGVRVLVYSGVFDVHYNYLALDAWTRSMTWSGAAALRAAPLVPWRPDTDEESSWGEVRQVGQLSVLRVANAGHETCRDLPQVCPAFFSEFVFNRTKPAAKTDDTEALANYSIVLPHGTPIDGKPCPCFRIPALVQTTPGMLVLFAEARFDSSECSPLNATKHPNPKEAPTLLVSVTSSDAGATWSNVSTVVKNCGDGQTCNPHAVFDAQRKQLVVVFSMLSGGSKQIAVTRSSDATGAKGWSAPWLANTIGVPGAWTEGTMPGPGAALQVGGGRLLFCSHGSYSSSNVVFFSDDSGMTFNVSASTLSPKQSVLQHMNECSFASLSNGSIIQLLRNFGGCAEHEDPKVCDPYHNKRCADGGMCKAYSLSSDRGNTWTAPQYLAGVRSGACEAAGVVVDGTLFISGGDSDTNPDMGRTKMALRSSSDLQHWNEKTSVWNETVLDQGIAAYSQVIHMASKPDEIGVLWEALSPDGVFTGEMRLQWVPMSM